MGTMNKFFKYFICFVLLFIFVTIASYFVVRNTYKAIAKCEIEEGNPKISIQEAKATSINGYLIGTVNNNTLGYISDLKVKADFYGKTGTYLGSEYLALGNFKQNETKEFRLNFKFNKVESYKVSLTEEDIPAREMTEEERTKLRQHFLVLTLVTLILMT